MFHITLNRQNEYINECGQNSFYIPDNVEDGFCKETIISVSSDFNNGALECGCNDEGSVDKYRYINLTTPKDGENIYFFCVTDILIYFNCSI